MSVDRGAVEGSDGYVRDGYGGDGLSWWREVLELLKLISFQ